MCDVYEYRLARSRSAIWLAAIVVAFLLGVTISDADAGMTVALFAVTGALIAWTLMTNPLCGIRVDDEYLVLNAWRRPRPIPLADIAYLRTCHWTDECGITIVYKDGREEGTSSADMPPANTLAHVMAERGIPLLDPALTPSDDSLDPASATPEPAPPPLTLIQ